MIPGYDVLTEYVAVIRQDGKPVFAVISRATGKVLRILPLDGP